DEPIDTEAVSQRLAKSGIVGGEVVDAETLNNDPFIKQVTELAERIQTEQESEEQPAPEAGEDSPAAENFRITDDHLGEGGAKTKYGYNVAAIRTLKQIEAEGHTATPQEQEILSRYVGWGGLPNAFDESREDWKKEYAELKSLLTPEEYDMARASTLNAHYTSPTVIRAIYDAVERMGFRTGNVLEPSCGVGNFFGLLPESMRGSRLYGVELDTLTGRIARQLYPKANITISGFEKTNRQDFFDLAIGNVPFGSYKLNDRKFNAHNFLIHDYFFAKALDQVRAGGVIAFITSKGTMDKASPDVRRYIAERAELLGAIRLPNNAFKANAGTEVTSDILFLQKRDRPIVQDEPWVHLGQTEDGIPINAYFAEHPEMVLGRMAWDRSMYGNEKETTCEPIEGAELAQQLSAAVRNIRGAYRESELPDLADGEDVCETLPADPNVKNYSYAVVDGQVYFRQDSIMIRPEMNQAAQERVKGLVALRDCVHRLMDAQMDDAGDEEIRALQAELNTLYDAFTEKYGLINARANRLAFADDSSYYLLCSLENVNDRGELESKADMFTKRTIRQRRSIDHADTAAEALALSIGERAGVDLPYMAQLTGKPEQELVDDLRGVIFRVPMAAASDGPEVYVTADEYLSGNVRDKLRIARLAAQQDSAFAINVEALEKAQPKDLEASEIDVRLGATWISADIIKQFSRELFGLPFYLDRAVKIHYSPHTAEWRIEGKSAAGVGSVSVNMTYGTDRANGFRILEDTLNLRDVRIYDTVEDADGSTKRVLNQRETTLAQQKQQAIKDAFQDWIWKDPQRRHDLVQKYNELFNSTRPREYDGSHIVFSGMNPEISLREHQRNAIAHVLYGGNTLLAHEVGAGKTYEMAAAAMESKRLGLCHKSMFVVPNHLTEQWASEFLRLYPGANILVTTKKDFEKANRKKFCARIATGDYDAIIIGHSQFERIPISTERQQRIIQQQIDEITEGIEEAKSQNGERFTIKQLEKTRKSLEARLEKLLAEDKKDDVVTFEELGVDRLFVDEAHAYKNLFLYTKMRNVAGLSTSEAQKSSDMFAKCRYMDELTGGKGVIFATGTPVSNSMTELYTMQRYLQYETLREKGLTHFDEWASTFGETTTAIELAPEGTGYRARTRFAKFFNLPELMNLFKEVADVKTSDQLNLPVPEAKFETIVAQPSELQQEMVESLSERAAAVHSGAVDPSVDNMLTITSDGRKIGLDQRLMNPLLPDDPGSKLNACVGNVLRIWEEGREQKLTQLIFCDMSTPKGDGTFNVYDDIRAKLIGAGVPESEIAFIHHADSEAKKKELFAKVRSGQVRVLLGSTAKMGAGTNVQRLLVAMHHLDVGWRPADMTQRNGRIIRQGNLNRQVQVYNYVTNGTFDAYLFQTLENKQKFISQIMTSKSPVRACDDVDEAALSYAEIKALCAGDERIKEKMDLDVDVARLKLMKSNYQSNQYRLEDRMMRTFPEEIRAQESFIAGFEEDLCILEAHPLPADKEQFVGMELLGKRITDKEKAGKLLLEASKAASHGTKEMKIGEYRGLSLSLHYDVFKSSVLLTMRGSMTHICELGQDAHGNLIRIENALGGIPARMEKAKAQLDNLHRQMAAAREELGKPFPQEAELQQKSARLAELDAALNMDNAGKNRRTERAERPSVLAALRNHPPAADRTTRQEREAEVR
ncbi:MAG: SNF2-related protein, partial [Candidatus Ventricola sp.]|nr:SNF2-related protein [Candidatus Ventricola sp.]